MTVQKKIVEAACLLREALAIHQQHARQPPSNLGRSLAKLATVCEEQVMICDEIVEIPDPSRPCKTSPLASVARGR